MATEYCTLAEVRAYGKFKTAETNDDALLEDLITRVSALFDNKCGRVIVANADATHYFTQDDIADCETDGGIKIGDLVLDDTLVAITTLTNGDGTAIAGTEYFLMPRAYERKSYIRIKEASTVSWEFDTDGYIAVAGRWAYAASAPEDVKQAVIESVLYTYHRRGDNFMQTDKPQQSMDGTRFMPIAWTQFAKEVIEHYRKRV